MLRRPRALSLLLAPPLLAAAALFAAWAAFPLWAPPLLRWQLAPRGIQLDAIALRRPLWHSLAIDEFALRVPGAAHSFHVRGSGATLHYQPRRLPDLRLERVAIAQLQIDVEAHAGAAPAAAPIALADFLPGELFPQLPLDRARIDDLQLRTPLPRLAALRGDLDYGARRLQLRLRNDDALTLQLAADADNQIDLQLRAGERELAALANRFTAAPAATAIAGRMRLDLDALQALLPPELAQLRGTAAANWRGRMPNAVDRQVLQQLALEGDFSFNGAVALPRFAALPPARAAVATRFRLADGVLAGSFERGTADLQQPAPDALAKLYELQSGRPLPVAIRIDRDSAYTVDFARRQLRLAPGRIDVAVRDKQAGIDIRAALDDLSATYGETPAAAAHAVVQLPELPLGALALQPTRLDASVQWRERRLSGRWQWRDVAGLYRFDGTLDYRPDSGDGVVQARSQPLLFRDNGKYLPALLKGWRWPLDLSAGQLALQGNARFGSGGTRAVVTARAEKLGGFYERNLVRGVDGTLRIDYRDGAVVATADALAIAEVDAGVPITNLRASLRATPELVQLRDFSAGLFGGSVAQPEIRYAPRAPENRVDLQLDGLQLAQIVALQPGVEGTGTIDGRVPLRFGRDGLQVDGAQLRARPPGGTLRYRGSVPAGAAQNPGLALALKALENFHYETMAIRADYAASGDMLLAVALSGRNPTAPDTPPVNFNLNIRENIPDLLHSLQIGNDISARIEQRLDELHRQAPRERSTPRAKR